jgi:hypothetical protein
LRRNTKQRWLFQKTIKSIDAKPRFFGAKFAFKNHATPLGRTAKRESDGSGRAAAKSDRREDKQGAGANSATARKRSERGGSPKNPL